MRQGAPYKHFAFFSLLSWGEIVWLEIFWVTRKQEILQYKDARGVSGIMCWLLKRKATLSEGLNWTRAGWEMYREGLLAS